MGGANGRRPRSARNRARPHYAAPHPGHVGRSLRSLSRRSAAGGFPGSPPSGVQPDFVANGGWAFSFQPDFKSTDYLGLINPRAMPRDFVPEHVETVVDDSRLQRLARPDFDPRQVAFVELPVGLPSQCRGEVTISAEDPF